MITDDQRAALINMCYEAEFENFNPYWVVGLINELNLFDDRNKAQRENIFRFLQETNTLTQRMYLAFMEYKDYAKAV
jgi:hypothetical protein